MDEHWINLINDERVTRSKYSYIFPVDEDISKLREYLINKVFDMGDVLSLSNITLQTAIIYIEKLLYKGKPEIIEKDKVLWAITALLLAAKYIELDDNIPFIRDFRKIIKNKSYTWDVIVKWEHVFLKILEWDLMVVTPLHFTECILNYWVLFGDDQVSITDQNGAKSYRYVSNIEFVYEKHKKEQIDEIIQSIK